MNFAEKFLFECIMNTIQTPTSIVVLLTLSLIAELAHGQGIVADSTFISTVVEPALIGKKPKVLFDEAHFNYHTSAGGYKPFVDLITSDGCRVVVNKKKFARKTLMNYDILVISAARGAAGREDIGIGGFHLTDGECDIVRDWIRGGGCLLFVTDHPPISPAATKLGERVGVEMSKALTIDSVNHDTSAINPVNLQKTGNKAWLIFSKENNLLVDHPIIRGRNHNEQIKRVMTFAGQSLKGPKGSTGFLKLGDTAIDRASRGGKGRSASGRSQGVAFKLGRGHVVVLSEAAMITAQSFELPNRDSLRFGMSSPGIDNRQLALNIMRWLAGELP